MATVNTTSGHSTSGDTRQLEHTCHAARFCGAPRRMAVLQCPACTPPRTGERAVAWGRPEMDPCQRGTTGCSIDHDHDPADSCEVW